MTKTLTMDCSHPNFCVMCSIFQIADPYFRTVVTIINNCTKDYEYPGFSPITKVVFEGVTVKEFNQTRCCEGSRSLVYTTDSSYLGDGRSSFTDNPLLLTMSIAVAVFLLVITIIIVVKYKKHSKHVPGKQEPCTMVIAEVVEYSTPVETVTVRSFIKSMSSDTHSVQDKSHVLERMAESRGTFDSQQTCTLEHSYLDEEDFYCTLQKNKKKCIDRKESVYSHFSDLDDNIYNRTIHNERNECEMNNVYTCV